MRAHLQKATEEMLVLRGNSAARADVPMFYRHSGQGPPLVWLHWLWGEPGWMPHHQQLAERFHVYAPDWRKRDSKVRPLLAIASTIILLGMF